MIEDIVIDLFDLTQQAKINPAHRARRRQHRAIFVRESFRRATVIIPRPVAFKFHERAKVVIDAAAEQLCFRVIEAPEVFLRQVNAITRRIFPDVTQDIRQLQRHSQIDGVLFCPRIAIGENFQAHEPRDRSHAIAVLVQFIEGFIAMLEQIHLTPGNQFFKIFLRHREAIQHLAQSSGFRRLRMPRVAGIQFRAPFVQFIERLLRRNRIALHVRIGDVVHNVVNFAAEAVNIDNRFALLPRQEEKRVEEIRLAGFGQTPPQRPRPFAQVPRRE